jgi:hypothetical protein
MSDGVSGEIDKTWEGIKKNGRRRRERRERQNGKKEAINQA